MNPLSGVLECLRLTVLVWRISDNESVLADVDTNVSHNNNILNNMQHQNILEPSLQMRGQSPVNCPDSDVKEWGQNIINCLMTNLMLLTSANIKIKFDYTMKKNRENIFKGFHFFEMVVL